VEKSEKKIAQGKQTKEKSCKSKSSQKVSVHGRKKSYTPQGGL